MKHIHLGFIGSTQRYYQDSSRVHGGLDENKDLGADTAHLLFYAGHGWPDGWSAFGETVEPSAQVLFGNGEKSLRYFWQAACQDFAHGPAVKIQVAKGKYKDYIRPDLFDPKNLDRKNKNVFLTWGTSLGLHMRMACGSSSLVSLNGGDLLDRIWRGYSQDREGVANSFLLGLASQSRVVPLCIARGGDSVGESPLADESFRIEAGVFADPERYYLQYILPLEPPERDIAKLARALDGDNLGLPVLMLDKTRSLSVVEGSESDEASGAVFVFGSEPDLDQLPEASERSRGDYVAAAFGVLEELQWRELVLEQLAGANLKESSRVLKIYVEEAMPAEGPRGVSQALERGAVVTFRRRISLAEFEGELKEIDVLGPGGEIGIHLNPDDSLFRASIIWRELREPEPMGWKAVKKYSAALEEARSMLGAAAIQRKYLLREWRFGYREESTNCIQREMKVYYEFDFVPRRSRYVLEYPLQMIEIPALLGVDYSVDPCSPAG